ncbi:HTTM domain-containing protein [Salinadaptatus halalkaliphilus]|uniref:HTTM domain-containing protein n=1 Tax=Salinadaptatus halalkaliphilus TaxID=2419781 RepID=A0A4S3TST6_9EURY|nr:HTTM domain-containing protein [Salinadaptatus halalkaliphilus]THE65698.1 HTTM domain-containing protein [Salinadaptatus halalkaliphilus]
MTPDFSVDQHRLWTRLRRNAADSVRIDTRSLAVFRILVGLLALADLFLRSRNFSFYYTDDGLMPQSLAMEMTPDPAFSFFYLTADPTLIAALFVLHGLVAIQLLLGYKTRIATILTFLFVISLDYHNPAVTSYADVLFRLLLFWAIFLPLGERWSIDAVHANREPRGSIAGVASALILFQIVYMYFHNGYHKLGVDIWESGEAAAMVMGLDDMTFLLAGTMRQFPTLLQIGGFTWFAMLILSWLLIVLIGRKRMLLAGMFMVAHASFAITVRIGAFAYVAIAGLVLFMQAQVWADGKTVLDYVGVDYRRLLERGDVLERYAAGVPELTIDNETVDRARSAVYSVSLGVVALSLVTVLVLLHTPVGGIVDEDDRIQDGIDDTKSIVNADQPAWTVFAPIPRTTDRYYVFAAETAAGDRIDVYNERPLTYDRPGDELQLQYDTYRERFFMNSVRRGTDGDSDGIHTELAEYYCTTWAEEHDVELTQLNMYMVSEDVTMDTITERDERDTRISELYQYSCDDSEPETIQPPER